MKFSHSIQFNAVPDWSSHYIAYSNLKKLCVTPLRLWCTVLTVRIYQLEKTAHQGRGGDTESRPLIGNEEPEEVFGRSLGVELEKICSFYVAKEGELIDEATTLLRDVLEPAHDGTAPLRRMSSEGHHRSNSALGDSDDDAEDSGSDDDENTGLTKRRTSLSLSRRRTAPGLAPQSTDMTASSEFGRSARRYSTTIDDYGEQSVMYASGLNSSGIMLKKRIIGLYVQLCELKSYAQLNRTGFSKVLKKFDKTMDKELKGDYIRAHVDTAYPFKLETKKVLEENIRNMETAYTEVVAGGDEGLAKKDLRSHLREHVVWERNTVWRDLIGIERRGEAARLGQSLIGYDPNAVPKRLQGDEAPDPAFKQVATPLGRLSLPAWLVTSSMFTLILSVVVFLLLLFLPILEKPEQQNCLAMLVFVSMLWATEVSLPLPRVLKVVY